MHAGVQALIAAAHHRSVGEVLALIERKVLTTRASVTARPDLHKWALFWVFRVMFALVGWGLTVVLGTLRGVVL